jgi:hypothetical protein
MSACEGEIVQSGTTVTFTLCVPPLPSLTVTVYVVGTEGELYLMVTGTPVTEELAPTNVAGPVEVHVYEPEPPVALTWIGTPTATVGGVGTIIIVTGPPPEPPTTRVTVIDILETPPGVRAVVFPGIVVPENVTVAVHGEAEVQEPAGMPPVLAVAVIFFVTPLATEPDDGTVSQPETPPV